MVGEGAVGGWERSESEPRVLGVAAPEDRAGSCRDGRRQVTILDDLLEESWVMAVLTCA